MNTVQRAHNHSEAEGKRKQNANKFRHKKRGQSTSQNGATNRTDTHLATPQSTSNTEQMV